MPIFIAFAGGAGAITRYLFDGWIQDRTDNPLPVGTFVINMSGSFVLGIIAGLAIRQSLSANAKLIAGTGFLGGYTTFSTYAYETFRLAEDRAGALAILNMIASITVGLVAAAAGLLITGGL